MSSSPRRAAGRMSEPTRCRPSEEPCSSLNPDDSNPDDQMSKERSPMGLAVDDHSSISEHIPNVGMTFKSEKDAYDFYNSYDGKIGFNIRKCHAKSRADKTLRGKHFVCSNEGQKSTHSTHETKKERASTRSDCEARVEYMEDSFDKWASEVENLLSQVSLDDIEIPDCSLECTEDVAKTRVV